MAGMGKIKIQRFSTECISLSHCKVTQSEVGDYLYFFIYTTFSLSVHPLTDTGCFHALTLVTWASLSMRLQISLGDSDFVCFGYIARSRLAGLYGNSILNFLRHLHTVFQNGYTMLHSHKQCTRAPFLRALTNTCYRALTNTCYLVSFT